MNKLYWTIRIIIWVILVLLLLAGLSAFLVMYFPDFRPEASPDFSNKIVAIGTLALAFVTGLMAYFTFELIISSANENKRNRKERLLGRIIDWATNVLKINTDLWDAFTYHDLDIQLNRLPIVNIKSNVQALRDEGKSIVVISVEAGEDVTNAANTIWKELTTITNVLNALCVIIEFDDDVTTDVTIDSQTVAISKHNAPEIIEEHRNILAVPCNLIIDKSTQAIVLLSK